MSVIANTTVISNFASINQLDLLRRLFGALYISTEIYEEIRIGQEEGYQSYAGIDQMIHPFVHDGWIRLTRWQATIPLAQGRSVVFGHCPTPWLDAAYRRPRRSR